MPQPRFIQLTFLLASLALRPASGDGPIRVNDSGTLRGSGALFEQSDLHLASKPGVSRPGALTMESFSALTAPVTHTNAPLEDRIFEPGLKEEFATAVAYPQSTSIPASAEYLTSGGRSGGGTFLFVDEGSIQPVPEPATWVVAAIAAALILVRLSHQARSASARCLSALSARVGRLAG